ncbi:MAG: non-homologous end-joining DNA ligase [Actinomycetota bacterium]
MAEPENIAVELEGRDVLLTNLDRVLWPRQGLTKGWLLQAYAKLAPVLLPHLRGRPITMWRYPAGVEATGWWQNECRGAPEWVSRYRYTGKDGREHDHCVIDDLPSLLWLANLDTIEIHPFLFDVASPETPRALVFDLDPGEPADLRDACRIALLLRDALESQQLEAFAKTSGSKGLHVYVPLNAPVTFDETKAYARTLAAFLAREHPGEVVDRQARELRRGKVLVDWLQNDRFRSTVAPYSLRATTNANVSTPVAWEEVADVADGAPVASLEFRVDAVLERIEERGDLFEPVERIEQRLVG